MILFDAATQCFHLQTHRSSYQFCVYEQGLLLHQYFGGRVGSSSQGLQPVYYGPFCADLPGEPDREHGSMDRLPTELAVFGLGDFRLPAVGVVAGDGSRLSQFVYRSHTIFPGKKPLDGLPCLRAGEADAQSLEVVLFDPLLQLEAVLSYTVYEEIDVIARSLRLRNAGEDSVYLTAAASACLDLPDKDYRCVQLWGAHGRECHVEANPLHHGVQAVESRRGASSHQQNPFLALLRGHADEDTGEVYGISLIYSGNFRMSVEVDQYDNTRVLAGINPFDFQWKLEPGETFTTPEAVLVYSGEGLGGMSRTFHAMCRRFLGKTPDRHADRPVILNSWEAMYFDYDEDKVLHLIDDCRGLGVDVFVLDDGWFGRRCNDASSLGDWYVNPDKLPHGLTPLIEACHRNGMGFGLWIEPEMVSEDSECYRHHPDWCIQVKNRDHARCRNQLVLDCSRQDVQEYLYESLSALLSGNDIAYIKWDMNRFITNSGSAELPADRQRELGHRHLLGVYRLMDRITERFPHVLFEGCAGGGGRFDFGILHYMPQIWTSDNSDAICRLKIQYGTSLLYPPSAMVAHVSDVPNHQTGRVTDMETRAAVALTCNYGYELHPGRLTPEDRERIAGQIRRQKGVADLVAEGDFYRLHSPYSENRCAWMLVSPDRMRALAVHVRVLAECNAPIQTLRLKGLCPDKDYAIQELNATIRGDILMKVGIPLPNIQGDFVSQCFTLTAC